MTDNEIREWIRTCLSKVRFSNENRAGRCIDRIKTKRKAPPLGTYLCPHCGGWHLTKRERT